MQPLPARNLYDELISLPENLVGEILNGQLHTHPRPSGRHAVASSNLGIEIGGPYQRGKGGPGDWWIIDEPEIHFDIDREVVVPDIAGWRRERMPSVPDGHRFTVVPDWICEILSPSTASIDREIKKPLCGRYGVQYLWLVDPVEQSLEAYKLVKNDWILICQCTNNDRISVEPFDSISFVLSDLWS